MSKKIRGSGEPEPLLKVPEVAERLRCGTNAVYTLIHRNELRAVRIGRKILVPQSSIDSFIAGGRT